MVIGAIIIVGAAEEQAVPIVAEIGEEPAVVEGPLGCVEIMGHSVVERMADRFLAADVEVVSVLADAGVALPSCWQSSDKVTAYVVDDMESALRRTLKNYSEQGVGFVFVIRANVYTECDLIQWMWFHRGTHEAITRAYDRNGSLDLWIVDCAKREEVDLSFLLHEKRFYGSSYCVHEYVNQINTASDFRRLVTDVFARRCEMRPSGKEIRPGVWVEAGAEIHQRARIVAPAYIGRGARVREDTLITRCSNLESSCCIDYGTVIEDSSILANSYVGIWLDVSHAVVNGNKLANVRRNVVLEISDPSVIRKQSEVVKNATHHASAPESRPLVFAALD